MEEEELEEELEEEMEEEMEEESEEEEDEQVTYMPYIIFTFHQVMFLVVIK